MHPSKFFDECIVDEITLSNYEREKIKEKLKSIHPRNILGSSVEVYVVKVNIEYNTEHGNKKSTEKYIILPLCTDSYDSLELQAEIMCQSNIEKNNIQHLHSQLNDYVVKNIEIITRLVLPIG